MKNNVTFKSASDEDLSGVLHQPENGAIKAYALFAHCFTCTKDIKAATNIASTLAAKGIATLRFDFSGLGGSTGEFSDSSFSTNVQDLLGAAKFLEDKYEAPQILIGHSLGGTAVLSAAKDIASAKAVATIGSPASPEHILHVLDGHLETLENEGEAVVPLAGRPHVFKQQFVDDVTTHMVDAGAVSKALMVMHAPLDAIVSINEASKIFGQAKHPKTFVSLDQADHLLSRKQDAVYAGNLIASWADNYITPSDTASGSSAKVKAKPEQKIVSVSGKTDQAFINIAQAGEHRFIVDEPLHYGGTDLGPTPYDYLAVALGSCTSMTLNGYARRKKLGVISVSVRVEHDRIHAKDCDSCTKTEGKVDQFIRHIHIEGDITEAQRSRMLEIADLCPVHRTLENEIKIITQLEEAK